jgi:hypothetical protein
MSKMVVVVLLCCSVAHAISLAEFAQYWLTENSCYDLDGDGIVGFKDFARFALILTQEATYYVLPTGNDTTGDGSLSSPFATVSRAYNVALNGETINDNGLILTVGTNYYDDSNNGDSSSTAYCISTRAGWEYFAGHRSHWVNGKFIRLAANINFGGATVSHIGDNTTTMFSGTFDGGGYTLSNFTVDGPDSRNSAALFARLTGTATIQNLNIDSATVVGTSPVSNSLYAAILGGEVAYGALIAGCNVTNSTLRVKSTVDASNLNAYVGLIAGANHAHVTRCFTSGNVQPTALNTSTHSALWVGGVVGYQVGDAGNAAHTGLLDYCSSTAVISHWAINGDTRSYQDAYIGGIVGFINKPDLAVNVIDDCNFSGTINWVTTDTGATYATGGIAGAVGGCTITRCGAGTLTTPIAITLDCRNGYATGGWQSVGGAIGLLMDGFSNTGSTCDSCWCNSTVSVKYDNSNYIGTHVAGFLGDFSRAIGSTAVTTVTNCYCMGQLIDPVQVSPKIGWQCAGGFHASVIGAGTYTIQNCWCAMQPFQAEAASGAHGWQYNFSGAVTTSANNYWDSTTDPINTTYDDCATGEATSWLQTKNNYPQTAGAYDFTPGTGKWKMVDGMYPLLSWQVYP